MLKMTSLLDNLIDVIYPACCIACDSILVSQEKLICTGCIVELTPTDFHKYENNPVARKFYGKVKIEKAMAYFPFVKKGKVQKILHNLKYRDEESLSEMLGLWYGRYLISENLNTQFDVIIPIPLHPKKLLKRGYNQSDGFAKGLAKSLNTDWKSDIICRNKETSTQTKKTRIQRWYNVKGIFSITNKEYVRDKKILLVDDVVTTGATIESCANILLAENAKSVSIATIAYA